MSNSGAPSGPECEKSTSPSSKEIRRRLEVQLNKLMTTSVVMRVDDFTVYRVTTSGKKQVLKEFLCGRSISYCICYNFSPEDYNVYPPITSRKTRLN